MNKQQQQQQHNSNNSSRPPGRARGSCHDQNRKKKQKNWTRATFHSRANKTNVAQRCKPLFRKSALFDFSNKKIQTNKPRDTHSSSSRHNTTKKKLHTSFIIIIKNTPPRQREDNERSVGRSVPPPPPPRREDFWGGPPLFVPLAPPPPPPPSLSGMRSALLSLEWGRVLRELIRLHVVRGRPRTIAGVGRRTEACLCGGARAPTQARPPLSQPSVHLS